MNRPDSRRDSATGPTPGQPRTLPLRVQPAEGEALDSWLRRLAHRNGVSLRRLTHLFGLDDRLRIWRNYALTKDLPAPALRRIEAQAGLSSGTLDATVLDQFDDLGWTPIPGSRYCPACLSSTGGSWPLRWQLPHTFACTVHQCLLSVLCPACRRIPHNRIAQRADHDTTTRCAHGSTRHGAPCDADLLATPWPATLRPDDPRIMAQTWINQRLDLMDPAAITDLQDLDALAGWLPSRLMPTDLEHLGPDTATAIASHNTNSNALRRHNPDASLIAAAMACRAIDIITTAAAATAASPESGPTPAATPAVTLEPFTRNTRHAYPDGQRPTKAAGGLKILSAPRLADLSPALQRGVLHGIDADLSATERLRYRTHTASPRLPDQDPHAIADRARWIPQTLWPDWLVRLHPTTGPDRSHDIAATTPVALLLPGNPARNNKATQELRPWRNDFGITLGSLARAYPDILTALCNLAEHLDQHQAPIDYRRRRATFTTIDLADLTDEEWLKMCTAARIRPGNGARSLHARRYLFALLTGADLNDTRHQLALTNGTRHRYRTFERHLPVPLRADLHEHAVRLLVAAGIDEPLTWSPPAATAAGLALPGREPDDIDIELLHKLILIDRAQPRTAAELLGLSVHHVRFTSSSQQWPPTTPWARPRSDASTTTPRPMTALRARAERLLTPEFFDREHTKAGKSLSELTAQTGFSAVLISHYAKRAGIRLVARKKLSNHIANHDAVNDDEISPDWIREQAGARRRTNTDIARELGISSDRVRSIRDDLGIAPIPKGIYNDKLYPNLPDEIRTAVEGHRSGWQRLRRFQEVAPHHSINRAAASLGHHPQGVNLQIQRLEAHLGGPLLLRGHRYQPMTLTPLGQHVLDQLKLPAVRALLDEHAAPGEHQHRRPYRRRTSPPPPPVQITTKR